MFTKKIICVAFFIILSIQLASCSYKAEQGDGPPNYDVDVSKIPNAKPKVEPKSKYGNPKSYVACGKMYHVLKSSIGYKATGIASWYGMKFHKKRTSSGEPYDLFGMTAAHPTLPLPTYAKVTNLKNGKQVIVKINDRGPFEKNRLIDLSYAAAKKLEIFGHGTGFVELVALNPKNQEYVYPPSNGFSNKTNPMIYLQLGSYANLVNAKNMEQRAKKLTTFACNVYPSNKNGKTIYQVQVGPISKVATADKVYSTLVSSGLPEPVSVVKNGVA